MFLTLRKNFQEMFPEGSWGTKNGGSMALRQKKTLFLRVWEFDVLGAYWFK